MERFISLLGLVSIVLIAFLFSHNRRAIRWKSVAWGFGLQFVLALIVLKTALGRGFFAAMNDVVIAFLEYTQAGAGFVFGGLTGHTVPVTQSVSFSEGASIQGAVAETGAFFAFSVLPTIIFFSAFMAILYHLGWIQKVVQAVAWVMAKSMKTSGAESLSASANIFVGQTEAPLVVRPYVAQMTKSELMAIMTGGFATVAGGVLAAYVAMLKDQIPSIAGHLMAASLMAAPAALALAKIFYPETEEPVTLGGVKSDYKPETANVIDAAASGASQGVSLAINVAAMLIAFLAIVALINGVLGWSGAWFGFPELSLSWVFGKILSPFAFLLGVPWKDCAVMGDLLGNKLMINEFVAYAKLQELSAAGALTERTMIIASYALCGFANLGSIGIQLGGIGGIAPERRSDLATLGVRAMCAGALASCSSACIAGLLI